MFSPGQLVLHRDVPGIARVGETHDGLIRLDLFESAALPVADSRWVPEAEVRRAKLSRQTRVFFRDEAGRWRAGRVVGGGPDVYFVRLPNLEFDTQIAESRLFVRWERPPQDPMQVLLMGANETPRYWDVRSPVREQLFQERAACASATGIISSGVRLHAHQINGALKIIRDPIQRYLIADEVGMGKTIEAGYVIRQLLLDSPGRRIGVIVPDPLIGQWRDELLNKFFLDDFPTPDGQHPFEIRGHGDVDQWNELVGVDMLVVDEVHLLAGESADEYPYRDLTRVAHRSPRLLLLSATPFSRKPRTQLALLHLLDPELYRWENEEQFERLLSTRRDLALAVYGLDEDPEPDLPELLELQFAEIRQLLPDDETLAAAMDYAMSLYGPPGTDPETVDVDALRRAVGAVRTHISETYRLHHRVIRNRRHVVEMQALDDEGLLPPFQLAGRTRPRVIRQDSTEASAAADAVVEWTNRCASAVVDLGVDPSTYGPVLGVLQSRVGGPAHDLADVLRYRTEGIDNGVLTKHEQDLLMSAPVLDFESRVLERLEESVGSDGLEELVSIVEKFGKLPDLKAIVFCGRGSLASDLYSSLAQRGVQFPVYAHVDRLSLPPDDEIEKWRSTGGVMIADDTGDVGRNFQEARQIVHARIPWSPNILEQRIGRVDRYSDYRSALQYVTADGDSTGIARVWLRLLANGFDIFSSSISAMQEVVDELTNDLWARLISEGIENFESSTDAIRETLAAEKRRINEIDALESSFGSNDDGSEMALAISRVEERPKEIEETYRNFIEGREGLGLISRRNADGSLTFEDDQKAPPLLSARLLRRLLSMKGPARSGFFDRCQVDSGRRLFRTGNPFIDSLAALLELDDRGQAVAMWRWTPWWPRDTELFLGFDFIIEADLGPVLEIIGDSHEMRPIARRRADTAFRPQHHRIWVLANNTGDIVHDQRLTAYLSAPVNERRDTNLNVERISALHQLVGGQDNLEPLARTALDAARQHLAVLSDLTEATRRAAIAVRDETDRIVSQSRARKKAHGLVADPGVLDAEVELGRAIEKSVTDPTVTVSAVRCVVVSAENWRSYVAE